MTKHPTRPIASVTVPERLRKDYGEAEMDSLMQSIETYGIIQPIVVNQDGVLVAGGRRIQACQLLGLTDIPFVVFETMSEEQRYELELEENLQRKAMTWQELVLAVDKRHSMAMTKAALEGDTWGLRMTGILLNMPLASVQYCTKVARYLIANDTEILTAPHLTAAVAILMRRRENEMMQHLTVSELTTSLTLEEPLLTEGQDGKEVQSAPASTSGILVGQVQQNTISVPLSTFILQQPDLTMSRLYSLGEGVCDHCITDPPFGVDTSMQQQENMGLSNVETIAESHTVDQNKELFYEMFGTVYRAVRENGFFVLWCDLQNWQLLVTLAERTGWRVQRWPVIWVKTHPCMNMAAAYNSTKDFEVAMVCRKPGSTWVTYPNTSVIHASNGDVKARYGDHPYAKPPEVWQFFIDHLTMVGQTILDPFAGRGSGVLPVLAAGRKTIALEYSDQHYPFLVENVKQYYLKQNPNTKFT